MTDRTLVKCFITHIEIVDRLLKMWVQCDTDVVKAIERDIKNVKDFLSNSASSPTFHQISQKAIYFARYDDGEFYRCTVENTNPTLNCVRIMFIDFGDTSIVSPQDLKILNPEDVAITYALDSPPQATPYYLYGVALQPGPIKEHDFQWLKCLTLNIELRCIIYNFSVNMISVIMNQNVELSVLIIEKNLGTLISKEEMIKLIGARKGGYLCQPGQIILPDTRRPPPGIPYPSVQPPPGMLHTNTMMPPPGHAKQIENRKPTMQLYQTPQQKLQSVAPAPQTMKRNLQPQTTRRLQDTFILGETYEAYVSHVEDGPLQFYLQIKSYADRVLPNLNINMNKIALQNLSAAVTQGTLVVGMHPGDKTLKRGMIINVGSNSCKVYYVDFGSSEDLPYSHIFHLPDALNTSAVAGAAVTFALGGITEATDSVKKEFQKLVAGQTVIAKVVSDGPIRRCELRLNPSGESVASKLISLAQPLLYLRQPPPRDSDLLVTISHYESGSQVYCQIGGEEQLKSVEAAVSEAWISAKQLTSLPIIGTPVLALYSDRPYRAQVMGHSGTNSTATVFYVDYGNTEQVRLGDMREASKDVVFGWRAQAVECCLVGCESVSTVSSSKEILHLLNKLQDSSDMISIRVISLLFGDRLVIDILDKNSGTSQVAPIIAASIAASHAEAPSLSPSPVAISVAKKDVQPQKSKSDFGKQVNSKDSYQENAYSRQESHKESHTKYKENLYHRKYSERDEESAVSDKSDRDKDRSDKESRFGKDRYRDKEDRAKDNRVSAKDQYASRDDKGKDHFLNREDRGKDNFGNKEDRGKDHFGNKEDRGKDHFGNREDRGKDAFGSRGDRGKDRQPGRDRYGDRESGKSSRAYGDKDDWRDNKFGEDRPPRRDNRYVEKGARGGFEEGRADNRYSNKGFEHDDRTPISSSKGEWDSRPVRDKYSGGGNRQERSNRDDEKPKPQRSGNQNLSFNKPLAQITAFKDEEDWTDSIQEVPKTPTVKQFSELSLKPDQELSVILSSFDAPDRFFVQVESQADQLDKIRTLIDGDKSICSMKVPSMSANVGAAVLTIYPDDGLLYRATITKVHDANTVLVLFVDYGNSSLIPKSELYCVPEYIGAIPTLSTLCCLADVKPSQNRWPQGDVGISKIFESPNTLILTVENVKSIDGRLVHQVKMKYPGSDETVSQKLVKAGYAKFTGKAAAAVSSEMQEAEYPLVQTQISVPDSEADVITDNDEEWIERLELLVGQFLHVKVVSAMDNLTMLIKVEGTTLVAVASFAPGISDMAPATLLGSTVIALVNCVLSNRLSITVYNEDGKLYGDSSTTISPILPAPVTRSTIKVTVPYCNGKEVYLQRVSDSDRAQSLLDTLFDYYEGKSTGIISGSAREGTLVAAKSNDGNWYRARVIAGKQTANSFNVYFIDYGNTELVTEVRLLDKKFYVLPELAIKAEYQVKHLKGDLNELIGDNEWMARLVNNNSGNWLCDLISTDGSNTSLIDKLKATGCGEYFYESPFLECNSVIGSRLLVGDTITVSVTHVESPSLFWVQLEEHIAVVEALQERLQSLKYTDDTTCGVFATCYAQDSLWYRAIECDPSNPSMVRFIDYGNCDTAVERKELTHQMRKPCSGYAVQMMLCCRSTAKEGWSSESLALFNSLVDMDQLQAKIISVSFKIIVDLISDGVSISKELIDAGYAVYDDLTPQLVNNYLRNFTNDVKTNLLDEELPPGEERKKISLDGRAAFISHVETPSDFYIQLEDDSSKIDNMVDELAQSESFSDLTSVQQNSLVAALFADDGAWYRAKVLSDKPPYNVHFLDYGNKSTVDEVKELPPDLKVVPALAYNCTLSKEITKWEKEVCDNLYEAMGDGSQSFTVKAIDLASIPYHVSLIASDGSDLLNSIQAPSSSDGVQTINGKNLPVIYSDSINKFYVQLPEDAKTGLTVAQTLQNASNFPVEKDISVGKLIAAMFPEHGMWYRAKVLSTEPEISVLFVDFGFGSSPTEFRKLPEDLQNIRPLVVECCLSKPEGIKNWTEDAENLFFCAVADESALFNVKVVEKVGDVYTVTLTDNTGRDVSSSLITTGPVETKPILVEVVPMRRLAYVSLFTGYTDIYLQFKDDQGKLDKILDELKPGEDLSPYTKSLEIGDLVAAEFPEDGMWYRSRIEKLKPKIEVMFIDYGCSSEITSYRSIPDSIKDIPPVAVHCELHLSSGALSLIEYVEEKCHNLIMIHNVFEVEEISSGEIPIVKLFIAGSDIDLMTAIMESPVGSVPMSDPMLAPDAYIDSDMYDEFMDEDEILEAIKQSEDASTSKDETEKGDTSKEASNSLKSDIKNLVQDIADLAVSEEVEKDDYDEAKVNSSSETDCDKKDEVLKDIGASDKDNTVMPAEQDKIVESDTLMTPSMASDVNEGSIVNPDAHLSKTSDDVPISSSDNIGMADCEVAANSDKTDCNDEPTVNGDFDGTSQDDSVLDAPNQKSNTKEDVDSAVIVVDVTELKSVSEVADTETESSKENSVVATDDAYPVDKSEDVEMLARGKISLEDKILSGCVQGTENDK